LKSALEGKKGVSLITGILVILALGIEGRMREKGPAF
jgi:hypothetical protein